MGVAMGVVWILGLDYYWPQRLLLRDDELLAALLGSFWIYNHLVAGSLVLLLGLGLGPDAFCVCLGISQS